MPISTWVAQGFVTATPGNAIDTNIMIERLDWMREEFDLIEVPYDRLNFRAEAIKLRERQENVIQTEEIAQNFMTLSYPAKWLAMEAPATGTLRHGNHPVMNWMAGCLQFKYDDKDNCQPAKPRRLKGSKRIDAMQAAVTALNRALLVAPPALPRAIEVW